MEARGFPVKVEREGSGDELITLADVPYIPVKPEREANQTQPRSLLQRDVTVPVLIFVYAAVIAVWIPWPVVLLFLATGLVFLVITLRSIRMRRRMKANDAAEGVVVLAEVLASGPLAFGGRSGAQFRFHLYGSTHSAVIPLPPLLAEKLHAGDETWLIVKLRTPIQCYYDPAATQAAVDAALAAAREARRPVARIAGAAPDVGAFGPPLALSVAVESGEAEEAKAATFKPAPPPEEKSRPMARGLFGWGIFLVICITLFMLLNSNRAPSGPPLEKPRPRWHQPAQVMGGLLSAAGTIMASTAAAMGIRRLREQKRANQAVEWVFSEEQAVCRQQGVEHIYQWSWFTHLLETPSLLVMCHKNEHWVLPRRAMSTEESARLMELLGRKMWRQQAHL